MRRRPLLVKRLDGSLDVDLSVTKEDSNKRNKSHPKTHLHECVREHKYLCVCAFLVIQWKLE